MYCSFHDEYFKGEALELMQSAIALALLEDGRDLTSEAVFPPEAELNALIVAKEKTILAGLPFIPLIMENCNMPFEWKAMAREGDLLEPGTFVAGIRGRAAAVLKAERIILNFITHLSGVANLTSRYVKALEGTGVRLLDTRKTMPCLRWPDKYAVRVGGGCNHRRNLVEMLMLKDNHIDASGSMSRAVALLREKYNPCPPIVVECRNVTETREAVALKVNHILLDNMEHAVLSQSLALIPAEIAAEISGGVTLNTIRELALTGPRRADYISVGRLTHSAVSADFSMRINKD